MQTRRSRRWLAAGLVATSSVAAQIAPAAPPLAPSLSPPGFSARPAFTELQFAPWIRAMLPDGNDLLLAVADRLVSVHLHAATPAPVYDFGRPIAFLARSAQGDVLVGMLNGDVVQFDVANARVQSVRAGVANSFDAVALPTGELLVSANPQWPAPGSHSGVWLVPGDAPPREVLALTGPSAPLALLPNGDLVAAELGATLPVPPGAARLLRVPANRVQAAVAGQTLTMADVVEIGAGYDGIYDLAFDDGGRAFTTDAASGALTTSAPGTLAAGGAWLDFGGARFATHLAWRGSGDGAFRSYQPAQRAPSLLVATTDYATWFEAVLTLPKRPHVEATARGPHPAGPVTLALDEAPTDGVAIWLAALAPPTAEVVAITWHDRPIWLGLPLADAIVIGATPVDTLGHSSWSFVNPGVDQPVHWQAVVWSETAPCSSNHHTTHLQP